MAAGGELEEKGKKNMREKEVEAAAKYQKSYFDVLGLCCSSEVPLIEKILHSLDGIKTVSVIVPSRTVIVVHDTLLVSQLQIVKALNQARLEANVRAYGRGGAAARRNWPNPYVMASGVLLALSFLKPVFHPMRWLAIAAVAAGLPPILIRTVAAVRRLTLDINILMLIAVGGAIALRDYVEAGSIVFLFTIAEWLESRASYKATAVMSALMSMAPQKAVLAETGEEVDAGEVKVGTVLAVKAGEVIPIDGAVVEGRSEVDESSLTGESFPVPKQAQSLVWAGTLNINGYISVKTTALAENSAVAKMTKLVEEAQNSKSKTQRIIDSCAKYYTPAVVLTAAGVAVIPLAVRAHDPKHWFRLALVLLVSACPCALVLSTPVATFCALARAASAGLLVKGGDFLETMARTRVVAFDKTGTLTRGEFSVVEFRALHAAAGLDSLLYWVSSIESKSSHPMARALVDYARSNSVEPKPDDVNEFQILPGEGIHGEIDGRSIYIGNHRIAARAGCHTVPDTEGMRGVTIGYVFAGDVAVVVFSLSDTCRTGAEEAVRELKQLGIKTAMLTGDSTAAAAFVQHQLGNALDMVHAELLPEDKVRIVRDLKAKLGPTAMIGDGMNDAPAMAAADIGVSMGISGSAVAMETSHITLMSNDVRKVPAAVRLSRRTKHKIVENILLSVATKVAILALAFAGHPLLWAAIASDVGTCLLVIFNSMLLLKTRGAAGAHGGHDHHHHAEGTSCGSTADQCCKPDAAASEPCCGGGVVGGDCSADVGAECGEHCHADLPPAVVCHGHSYECSESSAHSKHDVGDRHGHCHTEPETESCHGHEHEHVHVHEHEHEHEHEHGCSGSNTPPENSQTLSMAGKTEPVSHDSCTHKEEKEHHHHHHHHNHLHPHRRRRQEECSKATCYTPHPHNACRDFRKRCCGSNRRGCGGRDECCVVGVRRGMPQLSEITIEA